MAAAIESQAGPRIAVVGTGSRTRYSVDDACAHIAVGGPHEIRTVGNEESLQARVVELESLLRAAAWDRAAVMGETVLGGARVGPGGGGGE